MAPFDGDVTEFEQVTKPNVFSVEGLRDWLRTQDPNERYCYVASGSCLLHRYLTAQGVPVRSVGPYGYHIEGRAALTPFPDGRLDCIAVGLLPDGSVSHRARAKRHTFGAALSRCDAYLARTGA